MLAGLGSQSLLVVLAPTIVPTAEDLGTSTGVVGQARSVTATVALVMSVLLLSRTDAWGVRRVLRLAGGPPTTSP